jgi:hypothetical protein
MSYVTVVFTVGEVFVPRVLSVPDPSTQLLIESDTEVCVECINIRNPSETHLIRSGTLTYLPLGVHGCMKASCTKRSAEDSNSELWSLIFSESSRPSKDSSSSSKSSSKSSDSDAGNGLPLGSYDLVIFVGGDAEDQMLVENPSTEVPSTTPSSSNKSENRNVLRNVLGVVVIGLGLLVMAVALFSYWRKRNNNAMSEKSQLISHNEYNQTTYI